jgi:hypothetical protein
MLSARRLVVAVRTAPPADLTQLMEEARAGDTAAFSRLLRFPLLLSLPEVFHQLR